MRYRHYLLPLLLCFSSAVYADDAEVTPSPPAPVFVGCAASLGRCRCFDSSGASYPVVPSFCGLPVAPLDLRFFFPSAVLPVVRSDSFSLPLPSYPTTQTRLGRFLLQ